MSGFFNEAWSTLQEVNDESGGHGDFGVRFITTAKNYETSRDSIRIKENFALVTDGEDPENCFVAAIPYESIVSIELI